jgi:hypothetical protein
MVESQLIIVPVVLPLYARDSTIPTVLIDHCTRVSIPYARDSTILTVLINHCTRGSTSSVRMVESRV